MPKSALSAVRRRREALAQQGLRPVQIWAFDTRAPGFAEECRRQSRLAAEADRKDPGLEKFLDAALADLWESSAWE